MYVSRSESIVTPPGLEPGSTGCQTCTLTTMPKSQAHWYGSQSTNSSVVTITRSHCPHFREAHRCASCTKAFCAQPPTVLPPSRAPQTQVLHHLWGLSHRGQPTWGSLTRGQPTWGSLIQFYGPPMTTRQAIPLLTQFVVKGERSHPHPELEPGSVCPTPLCA